MRHNNRVCSLRLNKRATRRIHIHRYFGFPIVAGRFNANNKPVKRALKSFVVTFCFINLCQMYSANIQDTQQVKITNTALNRKL